MIYSEARPKIASGDILLFHGTGLFAGIIRAYTKHSDFSHVGLAWRIGQRVLIAESRPHSGGVTIDRPLSGALGDGVSWIPQPAVWTPECEDRMAEDIGVPYGWWNDLCVFLHTTMSKHSIQCAQYVEYVLGLNLKPTPAAIASQYAGKIVPITKDPTENTSVGGT